MGQPFPHEAVNKPGLSLPYAVCTPSPEVSGLAAYNSHGVQGAAEAAVQMKANESSGTHTQEGGVSTSAPVYKTTGHTGESQCVTGLTAWLGCIAPPAYLHGRHTHVVVCLAILVWKSRQLFRGLKARLGFRKHFRF